MSHETYRIGVLGLTHDHVWENLQQLQASSRGVLVAAADPHPHLVERAQREYGCAGYGDVGQLLERETLDAAYLYSDNATCVQWGERAAGRGLHLLVEKPLAANLAGADRLLAAARQADVRLMVNWPFAWWPQLQEAIRLARSGEIGRLWQVKYRAGHAGPKEAGCSPEFYGWLHDPARNGAGALLDYCCYGAALARTLLGMPSRVSGVAGRLCKEDILVEDNAVLVLSYPQALALSEASWTQQDSQTAYHTILYGTDGTLVVEPRQAGRLWKGTRAQPEGVAIEVPAADGPLQNASEHFLHGLSSGQPFLELCSDRVARDAQEILEAGLLSARGGAEVSLPLPSQ